MSVRKRATIDASRQAAYDALLAVTTKGSYLNLMLPSLLAERRSSGRDAAFATELAHGTARMQGGYDAIIADLVKGGLEGLEAPVLVALRFGAHQLLNMRVPAHAAVATSVELVRGAVGERPVRMVNAVLRRIGASSYDEWMAQVAPSRDQDLVGHLSVKHSHPRWITAEFLDVLGDPDEVGALLRANNTAPLVSLAVRPGLSTVEDLIAAGAERGRWSPYAATLPGGDPGALAEIRSGRAGVQDEGSQLAAAALAAVEVGGTDARWLDLCAGPGGKAALLFGLARERGATLVAAERLPHRARLVRLALRGYRGSATVLVADCIQPAWSAGTFDRAIADVPCTGTGALRRRPDSRWRRQPTDLEGLVPLQRALLSAAVDSVRAGGAVAYVTCSPLRVETREVVDAVIAGRNDLRELDVRPYLPDMAGLGDGPSVQLWPHRHGTDAMFISLLRRTQTHH